MAKFVKTKSLYIPFLSYIRKFRVLRVLVLLLAFQFSQVTVEAFPGPVKIMPLGNSITYDTYTGDLRTSDLRTGYRQPLWLQLQSAGYNVDFVGGVVAGENALPSFDPDNEGHPGYTDTQVASNVYTWLVANPADIVLLHIGTNDLNVSSTDEVNILNEIDRYEADYGRQVLVLVARIINRAVYSSTTTTFNDNVEALVNTRIAAGDNLKMVDLENGAGIVYDYEPTGDFKDLLHPNQGGFNKLSNVWYTSLAASIFTLDVQPSIGSGTVDPAPGSYDYAEGSIVELTATADPGWTFTGWSGDAAGSTNPLSVTMDGNKSITATFTQDTYTLSVVAAGSGSVSKNPDQPNYNSGTMVQLTATADPGWTFTGWSGDAAGSTNPLSVTMSSNKNITATFTQNTYTLSVVASGSGSVSKNPDQPNYNSGTVVQLTATADAGLDLHRLVGRRHWQHQSTVGDHE